VFVLIGIHDSLCLILFVSTNRAVWLTSLPGSPLTSLPLALLQGVTLVHWGLTPYGLSFKNIKELFIYLPFKAHTMAHKA